MNRSQKAALKLSLALIDEKIKNHQRSINVQSELVNKQVAFGDYYTKLINANKNKLAKLERAKTLISEMIAAK